MKKYADWVSRLHTERQYPRRPFRSSRQQDRQIYRLSRVFILSDFNHFNRDSAGIAKEVLLEEH